MTPLPRSAPTSRLATVHLRGLGSLLALLLLAGCAGVAKRDAIATSDDAATPDDTPHRDVAKAMTLTASDKAALTLPPACGRSSQPKCLTIKIFDVGQGSTAFALFPDGTSMLFDAGGSGSSNAAEVNDGINALLPYGDTIDYLVLSHSDNDHTNLLNRIDRLDPDALLAIHLSGEPSDYASAQAREFFGYIYVDPTLQRSIAACNQGKEPGVAATIYCYGNNTAATGYQPAGFPKITALNLYSYFLAVNVGSTTNPPTSSNEGSLVSGINYAGFNVMFPGDAEGTTQTFIQTKTPSNLWKNTMLYPMAHHGSGTNGSNAVSWLQAIRPRIYVSSSKLHQGWYHPSGSLIHDIRTDPVLSPRLYTWTNHYIFSSSPGGSPTYCTCNVPESILSTYTNGTITVLVDKNGEFQLNYPYNATMGLPACPVPNANYC